VKAQVWPPLPDTYARSGRIMWQACCLGYEPAESLHWIDREHLVATLVARKWPLPAIAGLTRMTCYTTARIAQAAYAFRMAMLADQFEGRAEVAPVLRAWHRYDRCPTCRRVQGERCRDTRCSELVLLDTPHPDRPLQAQLERGAA
jgi:hypothetical protein